ncbi:MoxR-like ATPase [Salirhabdus euzebyi]|uniref:MoxR-like ATPase n=1 Tax=Salirhabdus euzebyi TaxID=394506 RepID=A0A841Q524_9BACI|nr:MoxR family ATPase [Salirhabdus euzebyi]MBB6453495.1 MoxR-like ATPase [Salirhabdus euzebyi]
MAPNNQKITEAKEAISQVIYGNEEVIELLFTALLAKGHVLLESVPGSGKTQLAKTFAKVIEGKFSRVQFTPDVLPSDVTGIQFFNPKTQSFELRYGPVMTNILLADEINRATPKTQSSLLEVMEEHQTTIDGETIKIQAPFIVLATQNPIESNQGTFPLPEAQLDRFLFKVNMLYPALATEKKILKSYQLEEPLEKIASVLSKEEIVALQEEVKKVKVSDVVLDYLLALVHETRNHADIELGISTRGTLALMRASQARAFIKGREYITPEDVKELAYYAFEHRIILSMEASLQKTSRQVIAEILKEIQVPVEFEDVK